jgi:effector-binding domain-containing protein
VHASPKIITTNTRLMAVIHLTVPWGEIQRFMEPALSELLGIISAQGIGPVGAWSNHHLTVSPSHANFEVSVPVSSPVSRTGRVEHREVPSGIAACSSHLGAYEGLGSAWRDLNSWIKGRGYTPAPDLWECYVVGPESCPDPAAWRTELTRPLIGLGAVTGHE